MYFDFKAFIKLNFRAFFNTKGQPHRLTIKRGLFLALWLPLYSLMVLNHQLFFLLDEVFYPNYRQQAIRKPVMMIGNPRSGTTFLYRLLSQDRAHFTSFTLWELVLAPSIIQRKVIWALGRLDDQLGNPAEKLVKWVNQRFKRSVVHPIHKLKLKAAEEDEHVMFYSFSTILLHNFYPFSEVFSYAYFDEVIPAEKQRKIMRAYHRMLQRHVFAHGGEKVLLSKNPSHSSKIQALSELFPDARFIKLVRNPLDAVPSMLNLLAVGLKTFCDPPDPYVFKDDIMALMRHHYLYPMRFFEKKTDACKIMRYEDLVNRVDREVEELYRWLGIELTPDFQSILTQVAKAERNYQSAHEYSLEAMGVTEAEIFSIFREVFALYGFDERGLEPSSLEHSIAGKRRPGDRAQTRPSKKHKLTEGV